MAETSLKNKWPKKRNKADQTIKSIWEETLVDEVCPNRKHSTKLWNWLINVPTRDISDAPFADWCVPKIVSARLVNEFKMFSTKIVQRDESARGDTTKLLVELQDGHRVETVVIRHKGHSTVCVSSQVGCKMGCRFCATGTMGIIGDLTTGEIIEQLFHAIRITPIRNVVFMGMGEPLNNFENVKSALLFMIDNKRFGLSPKHVTVSTVGVIKNMYRLTDELPAVSLALSLHAPNQEVRLRIIPAASCSKVGPLMDAVDYHIKEHRIAMEKEKQRSHELIGARRKMREGVKEVRGSKAPKEKEDIDKDANHDTTKHTNQSQILGGQDQVSTRIEIAEPQHNVEVEKDEDSQIPIHENENDTTSHVETDVVESGKELEGDGDGGGGREPMGGLQLSSGFISDMMAPNYSSPPNTASSASLNPSPAIGGKRPSSFFGVMIEYILISGVNDLPEHAEELGRLLAPRREHILLNLIPYNPTDVAEDFSPPTKEAVHLFFSICRAAGIHTRVRQEMGQDIAGACGQLALVNPKDKDKDRCKDTKEDRDLKDLVSDGKDDQHSGQGNCKGCGKESDESVDPSYATSSSSCVLSRASTIDTIDTVDSVDRSRRALCLALLLPLVALVSHFAHNGL